MTDEEKKLYIADSIRDACYINELWQQLASQAEQVRKLEDEIALRDGIIGKIDDEYENKLAQANETIAALQATLEERRLQIVAQQSLLDTQQARIEELAAEIAQYLLPDGKPIHTREDAFALLAAYDAEKDATITELQARIDGADAETFERVKELRIQLQAYRTHQTILTDQHSERELELLAVIEQMREAMQAIADPNSNHPIFFREGSVSGMSMERMYEEIAQQALALTPDLSALKEHEGSKTLNKKFKVGDTVRKVRGSQWHGSVVGEYSTSLTPEGYAVESSTESGSVQIYPAAALQATKG